MEKWGMKEYINFHKVMTWIAYGIHICMCVSTRAKKNGHSSILLPLWHNLKKKNHMACVNSKTGHVLYLFNKLFSSIYTKNILKALEDYNL